ncbi:siphovirus ReqiPepy6 Gp37-like family protein [Clostridium novyi]
MELWILDSKFNRLGILEKFDSLSWVRRYYKAGSFELNCDVTKEALELLQINNLIYKKSDDEIGVIEYRQLGLDVTGKEILIIRGRFITSYLSRRIIWDRKLFNDTIENIMRNIVNESCINPSDKSRIIPNLILGDLKGFEQKINYQVSYKNVLEEIEKLAQLGQFGYKISFDPKTRKMLFNIYKGLNKTAEQNTNPRCIFTRDFDNVLKQEYIESIDNFKNVNLVAGAGEGENRNLITIGEATGLNRFEVFTDARDLQDKNITEEKEINIPKEKYLKMLTERGNVKLNEHKKSESFTNNINTKSNLKYKVDFDLGDIVTCISKKWGITLNRRIMEIQEVYEQDGIKLTAVFGQELPTIIDKIKQNI